MVAPAHRGALQRRLLAWWDRGHRALPWRFPQHGADPYRVWLAEVMLQQTQVAVALPCYRRFVEALPTLEALAGASEEVVLGLWSGLGYYGRGRRLREAARTALVRHGGLPRSAALLRELPGFGPYTAGAVASIAFAEPVPCVDGNVARALSRLFLVEGAPGGPAVERRLWALARALVHRARPGDWNQALMELGALVCVKPVPRCERCPLATRCEARRAGREREVPPARRRPAPRRLTLACALVERGGEVLLARQPGDGLFGGLWALPSVAVGEGEDPRDALRGALRRGPDPSAGGPRPEDVPATPGSPKGSPRFEPEPGPPLASVERTLTHRLLRLDAWRCRLVGDAGGRPDLRWFPVSGLDGAALPTAARRLLEVALAAGRGPARRGSAKKGEGRAWQAPAVRVKDAASRDVSRFRARQSGARAKSRVDTP